MKSRKLILFLFFLSTSYCLLSCDDDKEYQNTTTKDRYLGTYNVSYTQKGSNINVIFGDSIFPLDSAGCSSIYETFFGVGIAKITRGSNDSLIYTSSADTLIGLLRNDSIIFKPDIKINQSMTISPMICTLDTAIIYCKAYLKNNTLLLNYKITNGKGHFKPSPTLPMSMQVDLSTSLNGKGIKQ